MINFTFNDTLFLFLYLAVVMIVGLYAAKNSDEGSVQYFLAGKNLGWFVVGASLFMTNISSEHIIGLAGSGASSGLIVGHFEWMAIIALIMLGWVFAPLFIKTGVYTLPEFLEKRFSKSSRMYLAIVSIFAYITTKISLMLFVGGLLLSALIGWDIYTSAIVLVVITGIYTIAGGLRSVIYTGVVQMVFLLVGSVVLLVFGLNEVGGFSGLADKLPATYFDIFRPVSDPDFPWTGIMFGAPILGIWYWCTDQYIVQRLLSVKNINHAQKATIFTGFLKLFPVLLFIIPGMIAAVLYPNASGDNAFFLLVTQLPLPDGVRGLVIAGLLAALMSSLSAVFNSTATILTIDFYKNFYPKTSDRKLVLIGRLSAILIVLTGIFWVPLTKLISSNIYIYMQSLQAYISPPIAAVFLFGVFSTKVNAKGAIATLLFGGIIGALRLLLEILNEVMAFQFKPLMWFVELNFLHFAVFLFLVSSAIIVTVSLPFMEKNYKRSTIFATETFMSFKGGLSLVKEKGLKLNLILSAVLIGILLSLWQSFL